MDSVISKFLIAGYGVQHVLIRMGFTL